MEENLNMATELQALIKDALHRVRLCPKHHLNLGIRSAITHTFGPHLFDHHQYSGHQRRCVLALITVLKVLPLWQEAWPDDETVPKMIKKVKQMIERPPDAINRDALQEEIEELWHIVTDLTDQTRNIAGVVGMAAVELLSLALWDDFTAADEIELDREDSLDFMDNDVHFYAATAYAGGPPYPIALSSDSDADKRKEFWQWWLTEAVEAAWEFGKSEELGGYFSSSNRFYGLRHEIV